MDKVKPSDQMQLLIEKLHDINGYVVTIETTSQLHNMFIRRICDLLLICLRLAQDALYYMIYNTEHQPQ